MRALHEVTAGDVIHSAKIINSKQITTHKTRCLASPQM